jgi:hypothetical protein
MAKLLRQLRQATPEQLEAIERILAGPAVPERLRPGQPLYALHREGPLWRLRLGIQRFLRNLVARGDTVASPLRVRRGFAKHLERYLHVPSSRHAGPGARKARGELTDCLLYDPPAETRWAVSQ